MGRKFATHGQESSALLHSGIRRMPEHVRRKSLPASKEGLESLRETMRNRWVPCKNSAPQQPHVFALPRHRPAAQGGADIHPIAIEDVRNLFEDLVLELGCALDDRKRCPIVEELPHVQQEQDGADKAKNA